MGLEPLIWKEDSLYILDQRALPQKTEWIVAKTWQQVAEAIQNMTLRGAPLIGVAGAYGLALAQRAGEDIQKAKAGLAATRPTAVNLMWALEHVAKADDMLTEAKNIEQLEKENNAQIAKNGASLIPQDSIVMTICNTGSLATPGVGTALGVIREAHRLGKVKFVYACETRPRLQGLRLTAYELMQDGIPFAMLPDGASAWAMRINNVDAVIVGADRIAKNGDAANKIGTYSLAIAAEHHQIPFIVAAPSTTIDSDTESGSQIVIEERNANEVTEIEGHPIAPANCPVWNPAFDVTPHGLISHIVTESSVFAQPYNFAKELVK